MVAERSFFAFAEPADDPASIELATAEAPALAVVVRFTGSSAGEMRVTLPVTLAGELALAFAGDPDLELSDADIVDLAGEFTNMVTGSWLTSAGPTAMFDLSAPVVTRVNVAPPVDAVMQINGQPVGLGWKVA